MSLRIKYNFIFLNIFIMHFLSSATDSTDTDVHRRSAGAEEPCGIRKTVTLGDSEFLECSIDYPNGEYADHIIRWFRRGVEAPVFVQYNGYSPHIDPDYAGRIRLVEKATIEMSNIKKADEAWYKCSVVFPEVNEAEPNGTWIYLQVDSPPVLGNVSPSFIIQPKGATIDLYCDATGTPEPTLSWLKEGKPLVPSERLTVEDNRIQVRDLVAEDGGVYTCNYKNSLGQINHIMKLVIEGNVIIVEGPKNVTSREGERVRLTCQAEGYPNNITYDWFKNETHVDHVPGLFDRSGIYADGSFVINKLERDDAGWYKCRPSNGLGMPMEKQAYLNVTYLPRVIAVPPQLYLARGMVGRIECPTEANPPIYQVLWRKNDSTVDLSITTRIKINKVGTLIIKSVEDQDEGIYTCTPLSALGSGESSQPIQVIVRDPPYFSIRPAAFYQWEQGDYAVLPCSAVGDPVPQIDWQRADGLFPANTRVMQSRDGNLTIHNLVKEDQGTYECIAKNIVASIVTSTFLIIEYPNAVHAPYNVSVETTQYTATVKWLPGYDRGQKQHYVLWYKSANEHKNWSTMRVHPDGATSVTVHRLYPDKTYQFMVLSRSGVGEGQFSNAVTVQTKGWVSKSTPTSATTSPPNKPGYDTDMDYQGFPMEEQIKTEIDSKFTDNDPPKPPPPSNVSVVVTKEGYVKISWLHPHFTAPAIEYFVIQFRTVGPWVNLTHPIPGSQTEYTWKQVSRGATYHFRVLSYRSNVSSEPSAFVTCSTGDPNDKPILSGATLIGSIAGLVIVILLFIAAFFLKRRHQKRKQRQKDRYGNVKYSGPNQVEANSIKNPQAEIVEANKAETPTKSTEPDGEIIQKDTVEEK